MQSPFLQPGLTTKEGHVASLHLSRDQSLPVLLSTVVSKVEQAGYAEGVVTNTKFGSFPHTTLIGVPWGSQIRASKVDTGTRGRQDHRSSKKRKAEVISTDSPDTNSEAVTLKEATSANSGFIHLLPPTPENWTISLPHRTQVVYTPDYSYILHRLGVRPGSVLIEAGSGSGSFTHAAARAVFDGTMAHSDLTELQNGASTTTTTTTTTTTRRGKVFTYEFHIERQEKVQIEMAEHGLTPVVHSTHRDVYRDGFLLSDEIGQAVSPQANAIFLDLPAPWEALPHITRTSEEGRPSALDPSDMVRICTFSPCIEQVHKTTSALRRQGWLEIETVELQHKRIEVRRDFTGYKYEGMRSINAFADTVDEAISRLRTVEERARELQAGIAVSDARDRGTGARNPQQDASRLLYKEGRIIHRSEPEIKTHTSYLVFAVLPRDWSEDDEEQAQASLVDSIRAAPQGPKSQRQLKREAKLRKKLANGRKEGAREKQQDLQA